MYRTTHLFLHIYYFVRQSGVITGSTIVLSPWTRHATQHWPGFWGPNFPVDSPKRYTLGHTVLIKVTYHDISTKQWSFNGRKYFITTLSLSQFAVYIDTTLEMCSLLLRGVCKPIQRSDSFLIDFCMTLPLWESPGRCSWRAPDRLCAVYY